MGKPFNTELPLLKNTIEWADAQSPDKLRGFLCRHNPSVPLLCIGSGGSFSACSYASLLYRMHNGVLSSPLTPLELMYSGSELMRSSKLLYLSASGKNKDILTSIRYGVKYNESGMMALCLRGDNPTRDLLLKYPKAVSEHLEIPSGKDGFLATNSLVALFALLCRCYDDSPVAPYIDFDGGYTSSAGTDLRDIDNFLVLYGAYGEPVARDIESKLSEAALGATLLSDYRNFGHGRHHWFSKRGERSAIVALVSPREKDLAQKTISCLPEDVPVITITSDIDNPKASIDLLVKAFRFVADLGQARGIDPGKPGVPSYGRMLYNLNYVKLTNVLLPKESVIDVAVRRKCGAALVDNPQLYDYYRKECLAFIDRLGQTSFDAIAFDYDGTLSGSDRDSRYTNALMPEVREALIKLLSKNIRVMIATGRGKSVRDVFLKEIPGDLQHLVTIGYYNGAAVFPLSKTDTLEKFKDGKLDKELGRLAAELGKRIPDKLIAYELEPRNRQLTVAKVTSQADSDLLYTTCREIVWDKQLTGIHVWRSSHSMDIVVYKEASKLNVLGGTVLCIGDYGSVEGNDYELLTTPNSLSVDRTSRNPRSCWNLAPHGLQGVDATLHYLSCLQLSDGKFKCKLKI